VRFTVFVLLLLLISCRHSLPESEPLQEFYFEEAKFEGASTEHSFGGDFSLKVSADDEVLLSNIVVDTLPDLKIYLTARIKNSCGEFQLALKGQGGNHYYFEKAVKNNTNGDWSVVELVSFVPPDFSGDIIEVLLINDCDNNVFVDNVILFLEKDREYPFIDEVEQVALTIGESSWNALKQYRIEAYDHGYIPKSSKIYVSANIEIDSIVYPGSIKFKGA
jgi:hypothetical protein